MSKTTVTILGSTGSVGRSALEVIAQHQDAFKVAGLTGGHNIKLLIEQARAFKPAFIACARPEDYATLKEALSDTDTKVMAGREAVLEIAGRKVDRTISSIVGAAGLEPTMEALKTGGIVGLANKESLVCAGHLLVEAAKASGATLIPVDSEHSAIFQSLDGTKAVASLTLTASGGPFRTTPLENMSSITPSEAVKHPVWSMGQKISIDSATLMNKALELIEASYLFGVAEDQINIVIHPTSIIHSLVNYTDGVSLAQLGLPDMKAPIAYALAWPERLPLNTAQLDLAELHKLEFHELDSEKFPAPCLARNAIKAGLGYTAAFNVYNEVAVECFIKGDIGFMDIAHFTQKGLETIETRHETFCAHPKDMSEVLALLDNLYHFAAADVMELN